MFETLSLYDIPKMFCVLIENLYKYSSFRIICNQELSEKFYICKGTKTGDPFSSFAFILVIDRVFRPMFNSALIDLNIRNEHKINPLPIKAFADDIAMCAYEQAVIKNMIRVGEPLMKEAGLEVKGSKCAVLYERRSGNNWYKGRKDQAPSIVIQNQELTVCSRCDPYVYLGKSLTVNGEDPAQVLEFIVKFKSNVDKICACNLPITLKCSAINNLALAQILHHFYNTRLEEQEIEDLDKYVTTKIRQLLGIYSSTTDLIIYLPRKNGGIGIKRISDVYRSTRIAFLIKMINHSEKHFQNIARESLNLDFKKRKIISSNEENNFLGYSVNMNGYLNIRTMYAVKSDWIDLFRFSKKFNVKVHWKENDAKVKIGDEYYDDKADLTKRLFMHSVKRDLNKASTLSLQGTYFNLENIDEKNSHTIYYNWKLSDDLVKFVIKARLNILPTNFTLYIWNRDHDVRCPFCNHLT